MKRYIISILFALCGACICGAQNTAGQVSVVTELGEEVQVDSTLLGRDIFSLLPSDMVLVQDPAVRNAMQAQVQLNEGKMFSGFRIRIFIDSKRGAREESLAILEKFNQSYPMVKAYRTYSAPNFKVSVGNFRNRVEAEAFLRIIKEEFQDAFIVRDRFKYPGIGAAEIPVVEE